MTYIATSVVECDIFGRFFMCLTWRSTDLGFLATHFKILIYNKRGGQPTRLNEQQAHLPVWPLGSGWGPCTINKKCSVFLAGWGFSGESSVVPFVA